MVSSSILRSKLVQKPYQLFHYHFLLEKDPYSTVSDLSFDTDPATSLAQFKNHHWTWKESLHYGFLASVIFFVYIIFPASFLVKTAILAAFVLCFVIPLTSQFFVHALPIFAWLALYFSCGKIPNEWKPAISVKVLPALETIMYGDNLSNVLATINTSTLDLLAWIPYGVIHFSAPFIVAFFIFLFAPPTSLRSFGFAFGYMNLLGVITQILFPAAPPWYKLLHELEPANYSMSGSPGGLGRIDKLFGVDMYTTAFSNSPVIFGAFPSLHSGCSVMDVLFLCWLFPKFRIVWWGYATWLWWSTMYLTHHYFIDLIGGAVLSLVVFEYTKYNHLPVVDSNKFCRWSYSQIVKIDMQAEDPLSTTVYSFNDIENQNQSHRSAFPTFIYNQQPQPEAYELSNVTTRSRQSSRSYVPTINTSATSLATPSVGYARSSSSLNLPLQEVDEVPTVVEEESEDTSSLENSATPSVFDEDHHLISSTTSTTSLDELESPVHDVRSTLLSNAAKLKASSYKSK
ncbi:Aureobasidin A resistance protein [Suhomyces tanzawaensis NRRL Y-17324]|uniref:Aureobasidin A resistance protein n=1 Tax=Suhomyces tanzawaensis NRRL Y-17324 TaxID=984487 RepID=A0A1E4SH33_9ASCO|nr:Aureobasidin A resistance protein [Suhomyces tanzawaensis NRRL Y-17324]ODV78829.1 Aureobasidin A resistance protein [Suhomyces tanzawaensis NRRL Y-17324]